MTIASHLRARIGLRIGLTGLAATAGLASGCADEAVADRDGFVRDDNALAPDAPFQGSSTVQDGSVEISEPPVDYAPQLQISEVAVVYPLVLTVIDAPPFAQVLFDVESPLRSWNLPAVADALGVAEYHTVTSPNMLGGTVLSVRAEVGTDEGSVFLDPIEVAVAVPTCNYAAVAAPGRLDLLAENAVLRVCGELPALGTCDSVMDFHPWQAHDLLVEDLQDVVPENFAITAACRDNSIVGACCYTVLVDDLNIAPPGGGGGGGGGWDGRPFTVNGTVRHPLPTADASWCDDSALELAADLPRRVRRRLARMWAKQACDEHASIASFARLTLELLQLGAPSELVFDATRAQSDEIRHAETAFAIASHLAGAPVGPGRIDLEGAFDQSGDVRAILLAAVTEGCLNETICASWAARAAERADPALRQPLAAIAEDEARHAEFSWALVQWGLQRHPELAGEVAAVVDAFELGPRPAADPDQTWMIRAGLLSAREEHDLATVVLSDVIRPTMASLLDRRQAA